MELLQKFNPANLGSISKEDFASLTKDDVLLLGQTYPHMQPDLLIVKDGTDKPTSSATYRSLSSLLKAGHKFNIVGSRFPFAKREIPMPAPQNTVVEFLAPEKPIFEEVVEDIPPVDELKIAETVASAPAPKRTPKKRR